MTRWWYDRQGKTELLGDTYVVVSFLRHKICFESAGSWHGIRSASLICSRCVGFKKSGI